MGKGRSQESGARIQIEEHMPSAGCLPPTADCLLHFRQAGWRRLFAGVAALDWKSPLTGKERSSDVKNRPINTGMSMKTKGRLSRRSEHTGML
jgi:hypothetical protein